MHPDAVEVRASGPDPEPESAAGGWRLLLAIPGETTLCAGHFPGHPIVPGIAQLAWVEAALAGLLGSAPALTAVRGFRLRRPVHPGDELELRLRPGDDGGFRFAVRRGAEAVSDGRVEIAGEWPGEAAEGMEPAGLFPPVEELIPHREPMRFLSRVLRAEPGSLAAEAQVPAGNPLARAGLAPVWLALEAAAQAAAALEALTRREKEPDPRLGYLVGLREARLAAAEIPTGAVFQVDLRAQGSAPPLAVYEATAWRGGARGGASLFTATLSTYVPPAG